MVTFQQQQQKKKKTTTFVQIRGLFGFQEFMGVQTVNKRPERERCE